MKKKQVIWRRSISVFLALLLCLTLLPATALAANTTPRITAIGGNENQNISTSQSGNGWRYDAASTTLTLNGYNSGRIEVEGNKNQNFTLKLVGNNTITAGGSAYGLTVTSEDASSYDNPDDYMDFTITSDSNASLQVNGIEIVKKVNFIIGGSANVVSETTEKDVCALKGGGVGNCSVTIQNDANVTLRSGVEQTQNSFCLVPIMGNLTINTTGKIMIDASSTGGPAIQLYGSVNTSVKQVREMIIRWHSGGYSLKLKKPYAENQGIENGCRTAILHSDPYAEVDVKAGTLGYPRLNISRKSSGKFAKDDVITITANTPEGKRFKNWTWKCIGVDGQEVDVVFTGDTTASDANAEIKIPDPASIKKNSLGFRNLTFTANYEDIPSIGVTLSKDTLELVNGNSGTLTATVVPSETSQSVTWASSNTAVATVDESGNVTAVGAGTATITATAAVAAEGGEKPSASCTVTVKEAEYTVTLDPNEGTIADGKNVTGYVRGTVTALPTAAEVTREGYLFKGWYEDADFSGSPVTAISDTDTGDKTFYGKWAEAYTVTAYGLYGGDMGITPGETFTAKYAAGDTVGLQIGKRDGYTLRSLTLEGISEDALTWIAKDVESEQRGIEFTMPAESVTVTVNWRSNSSGSSSSSGSSYAVSAPSTKNGDVTVSPQNASKGDRVTITVKPDSGYEVGSVTVLDSKGNGLKLTDKGDGKYTFTMPGSKVTVSAEFVEEQAASIFADVPADAYYAKAVEWAVKKGITNGKANGLFGSNDPCTRG